MTSDFGSMAADPSKAGEEAMNRMRDMAGESTRAGEEAMNRMRDMAGDPTRVSDEAVQRIRELTERFIDSAKAAGNQSLDLYEKSLQQLVDFQEKAAGASQLDWVQNIAQAHAKFVQEVGAAYVSAAREMLK